MKESLQLVKEPYQEHHEFVYILNSTVETSQRFVRYIYHKINAAKLVVPIAL